MRTAAFVPFAALAVLTLGCTLAPAPVHPEPAEGLVALALDHPPAIAAQYRTSFQPAPAGRTGKNGKSLERTMDWRFWRDATRLASENLTERSGLRWQRDGAALFAQVLFHDQRRILDYQPDDWAMVGRQPSWAEQRLLIDPEVLRKLTPRRASRDPGPAVQRFVGVIGAVHWDVSMRADLVLPMSISKRTPEGWERTVLTEVHELQAAPWQPPPATGYQVVEFADLGDAPSEGWLGPPSHGLH